MFAIENMEASTIDQILAKSVDKNAVIVTGGHASHSHIKENFAGHIPVVEYNPEKVVKNNLDRLVKIAAIYTSDIRWRDYPNAEKDEDEII